MVSSNITAESLPMLTFLYFPNRSALDCPFLQRVSINKLTLEKIDSTQNNLEQVRQPIGGLCLYLLLKSGTGFIQYQCQRVITRQNHLPSQNITSVLPLCILLEWVIPCMQRSRSEAPVNKLGVLVPSFLKLTQKFQMGI